MENCGFTLNNNGAQFSLSKVGGYWMVQGSFVNFDTFRQGDKQTWFLSLEYCEALTLMLNLDMWLTLNI
jgi:hypothetical protein